MNETLFRYSGNKCRLIKYYKNPKEISNINRIIEPFAGSMAYSMHYDTYECVGIEKDIRIYKLWKWLEKVSDKELDDYLNWFNSHKENYDIRNEINIPEEWSYLTKLNSGSMMTGHISKNIIYPIAKPFDMKSLKSKLYKIRIRPFCILNENSFNFNFEYKETDLVFIDPPYLTSGELYNENEETFTNTNVIDLITKISNKGSKIIFTHGDNVETLYPNYQWSLIKSVINSKSRSNSTQRIRNEYVSYINF